MSTRFWIIPTPYLGTVASTYTCDSDGNNSLVHYTRLTVEEYLSSQPANDPPLRVVSDGEFDTIHADWTESACTQPEPTTIEQWDEAIGCLPPARWQIVGDWEIFHCPEHLNGSLVTWYGRSTKQDALVFTWTDTYTRRPSALQEKLDHHQRQTEATCQECSQ